MKTLNTIQKCNISEYPNGLPGKNALIGINPGHIMSMNKSGNMLWDHISVHDKLVQIKIDDAYYAKSFFGENNQHYAWTTRIIIGKKRYSYSIGRGCFVLVKFKDLLI